MKLQLEPGDVCQQRIIETHTDTLISLKQTYFRGWSILLLYNYFSVIVLIVIM